jgi:integrase
VAGAGAGKGKREQDGWLDRQNRALRDRGYRVSLDLHQGMVRLRATLPPKSSEPTGTQWKQRRISTGLQYPDQASEAVNQAEKLGADIEKATRTQQPFDWSPWERPSRGGRRIPGGSKPVISGVDAVRQMELWWVKQRKRSVSSPTTWDVDYARPLRPLLLIADLQPEDLVHLVSATELGSKTRQRCSRAAATVAKVLGLSTDFQQEIRSLGKGYSPTTDTAPRNLPSDAELVAFIDLLPSEWQWPVGICAVYGARPHEALLYADVLSSKLLEISNGKTGPRKSMALPGEWIQRWDLTTKRLPAIDRDRSHKVVGAVMSRVFRRAEVTFQPYDLRHAWAVRAIYTPKIGASMAAKSMGHSLQVHNSTYQRWFDASGMEALQAELLNPVA